MNKRRVIILSLVIALFVLGVGSVVAVANANGATTTDLKQQARQYQATWEAQHGGTHAPKATGSPAAESCPVNVSGTPTIKNQLTPIGHQEFNSYIKTVSAEGKPYLIYGETNQIAVEELPLDSCATNATRAPFTHYPDAANPGKIVLTAVSGDVVTFTTDAGTTGHFNYVTGQYL